MLAKLTSKNQLTLPKSVTAAIGPVQYFEVQSRAGQIILTPVRIQRGDALRAKLAELKIDASTIQAAVAWAEPAKKPRAKPLSDEKKKPAVRRPQAVDSEAANLKASLTKLLAKAAKR